MSAKKLNNSKKEDLHLAPKLSRGISIESPEQIFAQIFDNFPDIIHSVDGDGIIVATNQKASELLGYSREELIGKKVYECYADDIQEQVKKGFKELKRDGIKERIESKLKAKDGSTIPVEIRSLSLYDKNHKFVKTFSIIRDIRETNALKNQIVMQSKMAAIGELASGIMHDIRNPLSIITSYNSLLNDAIAKKDFKLVEKCQKAIEKASKRIERLTTHLRSFTRKELEHVESFQLSTIIEDSLFMLEGRLKDTSAQVYNELRGQQIELIGRANQLEQVFINLIQNACDAIVGREKKDITISAKQTKNSVSISIKDTGIGIREKDLEHIFDTFFTTKPRGEGTGLGLSICTRIIKQEGGKIDVNSVYQQGTEFIITLPKDVKK